MPGRQLNKATRAFLEQGDDLVQGQWTHAGRRLLWNGVPVVWWEDGTPVLDRSFLSVKGCKESLALLVTALKLAGHEPLVRDQAPSKWTLSAVGKILLDGK